MSCIHSRKREFPADNGMAYGGTSPGQLLDQRQSRLGSDRQAFDHARMYLHYNVTHGSIFINTAGDGTFIFEDIPEGPFSLQMSRSPGYQDVSYNPDGKPGQYPPFSLKDGEHRSGIVLKAKPACRVSGKILDEDGNIPENIDTLTVWPGSRKTTASRYESEQAHVNRADGSYSIDGLGGKPVYVMAINWRAAREGNACPPIYYPSTFSRSDAKLITFDKEQRVDDVNITLKKEGGLDHRGNRARRGRQTRPGSICRRASARHALRLRHRLHRHKGVIKSRAWGTASYGSRRCRSPRIREKRSPRDLDKTEQENRRDFTLKRGVSISGKFVDEKGKDWQIGESYGWANIVKDKAG